MIYDLIIVGGGPGGVAAGVYAARKKIKTLLITNEFGGQSNVSADIQNWIGTRTISGFDFTKALEDHLRAQEDVEIIDDDSVGSVKREAEGLTVATKGGKAFKTKTVLIASGGRRRKLGIPGEAELNGRGVFYCSTCDAPVMKDKSVAVVGGGNAGLEAVVDLLPYAGKIYLLVRSDLLKGDPVNQEKAEQSAKVEVIFNALAQEILGEGMVSSLRYLDKKTDEKKELEVQGVFVEIGSEPNSDFMGDLVRLNEKKEIVVDPKTQAASLPGIWAAGDVTDGLYKQNNISAGDAVKAVLNIYDFLKGN